MAEELSQTVNLFLLDGNIQGILDHPFSHQAGEVVTTLLGNRATPLPWSYRHANISNDVCWCHRACKQFFAYFAKLTQISEVITTVTIKVDGTGDLYTITRNLKPLPSTKKGASVNIGTALFYSIDGENTSSAVSLVKGVISSVKLLLTGLKYYAYVPLCNNGGNPYYIGSGSNSLMEALWVTPATFKLTPAVAELNKSLAIGDYPSTVIRTSGPIAISIDSQFLQYPPAKDYIPKYKMRVATNYKRHRNGAKVGCPFEFLHLNILILSVKKTPPVGNTVDSKKTYHRIELSSYPDTKNAFGSLPSQYKKYWQGITQTLPKSLVKFPYGAFIAAGTNIQPTLPPGYVLKRDDGETAGTLYPAWSYWQIRSNQDIGYGMPTYSYSDTLQLSDTNDNLTQFPTNNTLWVATDSSQSDHYRCGSPYSYRNAAGTNNPNTAYNWMTLQFLHIGSSDKYPSTDYTSTVDDFLHHSKMNGSDDLKDPAPRVCPTMFDINKASPVINLDRFSWNIYLLTFTKSTSADWAKVLYEPDPTGWTKTKDGLKLDQVIAALKGGQLGYFVLSSDNTLLNMTIIARAAIVYDSELGKTIGALPALGTRTIYQGIKLTYAYPNLDCDSFKVGTVVAGSWLWKRGSLGAPATSNYYNKWMRLGPDDSYCPSDLPKFIEAPAILKHNLPVDITSTAFVYCSEPTLWELGLLKSNTPDPPKALIKMYYLELFPVLTAPAEGYSNLPLKLDESNSAFNLKTIDPDTGDQLSIQVINKTEYYYKLFSDCSSYLYTALKMTLSINCGVDLLTGIAINSNLITGNILILGLLVDKVCSELDPKECILIKANSLITLDGTILQKDLTKKFSGNFNLDGRAVIVSCHKSLIDLAKEHLDKVYNKLYLLYLKQANNLKFPLTPCPGCLLNKLVEIVLLVYQLGDAWTYKTILSLPDKRESTLSCTDDPNGQFTIQRVALLVLWTVSYTNKDGDKLTTDKDDVVLYTYYKRCMANTVVQTTSDCLQNLPDNYVDDCKYYVVLRGKCGATLGVDRLEQAVEFFTYNHKPKYPSKPKPQFPCGTLCGDLPPGLKKIYSLSIFVNFCESLALLYKNIIEEQLNIQTPDLLSYTQINPGYDLVYTGCNARYRLADEAQGILYGVSIIDYKGCAAYYADIVVEVWATSSQDAINKMKALDLNTTVKKLIKGIRASGDCSAASLPDCAVEVWFNRQVNKWVPCLQPTETGLHDPVCEGTYASAYNNKLVEVSNLIYSSTYWYIDKLLQDDPLEPIVTIKIKDASADNFYKKTSSYTEEHPVSDLLYQVMSEYQANISDLFFPPDYLYCDVCKCESQLPKYYLILSAGISLTYCLPVQSIPELTLLSCTRSALHKYAAFARTLYISTKYNLDVTILMYITHDIRAELGSGGGYSGQSGWAPYIRYTGSQDFCSTYSRNAGLVQAIHTAIDQAFLRIHSYASSLTYLDCKEDTKAASLYSEAAANLDLGD